MDGKEGNHEAEVDGTGDLEEEGGETENAPKWAGRAKNTGRQMPEESLGELDYSKRYEQWNESGVEEELQKHLLLKMSKESGRMESGWFVGLA